MIARHAPINKLQNRRAILCQRDVYSSNEAGSSLNYLLERFERVCEKAWCFPAACLRLCIPDPANGGEQQDFLLSTKMQLLSSSHLIQGKIGIHGSVWCLIKILACFTAYLEGHHVVPGCSCKGKLLPLCRHVARADTMRTPSPFPLVIQLVTSVSLGGPTCTEAMLWW